MRILILTIKWQYFLLFFGLPISTCTFVFSGRPHSMTKQTSVRIMSPLPFCHVSFCSPQLYENFVEEVDAVDNGISQYDAEARYTVSTTLSARVGYLNPRWNSKSQDTEVMCFHSRQSESYTSGW